MKRDIVGAYMVIRRNGETVPFDASKIANALAKAFLYDAHGNPYRPGAVSLSAAQRERIEQLTQAVCDALGRRGESSAFHIEALQDQVELALMRAGEHEVARGYVLYREMASKKRAPAETAGRYDHIKSYRTRSGGAAAFDPNFWIAIVESVVAGLEGVSAADLFDEAVRKPLQQCEGRGDRERVDPCSAYEDRVGAGLHQGGCQACPGASARTRRVRQGRDLR